MDKKRKKWLRNIGVIMLVIYEVLPGNLLWRTEVEMTAADDFFYVIPWPRRCVTDGHFRFICLCSQIRNIRQRLRRM